MTEYDITQPPILQDQRDGGQYDNDDTGRPAVRRLRSLVGIAPTGPDPDEPEIDYSNEPIGGIEL